MAAQQASGGDGGVISAKEYVDVKVDGVRSDLQASIAELRAEVKGLAAKIEALPTTWMVIGTIAGGFTVSLGLIFAFLSYSNDNAEHVRARQKQLDEAVALSAENSHKIAALSERMDGFADQMDIFADRMDQLIKVVERDAQQEK